MTEKEVLAVMDKVANRLAHKYRFGYYDVDDMKQEARIECLKAMEKYDGVRPLENFLWTAVRNGLYNLKRNKFERIDSPCKTCPYDAYDPDMKASENGCTKYCDLMECKLYNRWTKRNTAKKNLVLPIELSDVRDESERYMRVEEDIEFQLDKKHIYELIDKNIPLELRQDWIKIRYDVKLPKARRDKVLEAIKQILKDEGIDVQKEG